MSAQLLLGKPCVESIRESILSICGEKRPCVCAIGFDDPKWTQYAVSLGKSASKYNCECKEIYLPNGVSPQELYDVIDAECSNPAVTGIIMQQPLPKEYSDAQAHISSKKDVDGLSPASLCALYKNENGLRPATPSAVIRLLDHYGVEIAGKHVVILGRGNAVGKPLALMMLARNATVTVCHTATRNLREVCRTADILVSACGVPNLVTPDHVTADTVVIDVGLSFVEGKTCGDVRADVYEKCKAVSPVPGGVGPVTRAILFENIAKSLKQ